MLRTKQKTDHYQLIADQLIELMQKGTTPWTRGWATAPYCNAYSGRRYTGLNPVLAETSVMTCGYQTALFVGFNQAKELGLKMCKGSKATWLRLGGIGKQEETDPETGEVNEKYYRFGKWVPVYNLDCFTDEDAPVKISELIERYRGTPNKGWRIEDAERLIEAQKAKIVFGGNRACYVPDLDQIHLPPFDSFSSPEAYYATAIHELSHRTGHSSRLDRELTFKKGSSGYAFEELVADMTAAFVCSMLGVNSDIEHHASYLRHWMNIIADDSKAFFRAYRLAQEAADLLLANAGLLPEESI